MVAPPLAEAANPPTITKIYAAPGPIEGGLAGDGSNLYFTTLAKAEGWTFSQVISLTASGAFRWSWNNNCPLAGGNMRTVAAINQGGSRLFVAADHGKVFCLETALSPAQRQVWEFPAAGSTLSLPVRSGIAYDPVAPSGGGGTVESVYFQANTGYTYALNAGTGLSRWSLDTGNLNGPPPTDRHPSTVSSTPVVGLDGTVYVGSANGYLYCIAPGSGALQWRVKLNVSGLTTQGEPIEATPAIGENGWIYVATRTASIGTETSTAHLYAINPALATGDTDNAVEKIVWTAGAAQGLGSAEPGVLAGVVVDACGVVYVADFWADLIHYYDGMTGQHRGSQFTSGKPCQAPALNRSGMLYLGTSALGRGIRGFKVSPNQDDNLDWLASSWSGPGGTSGEFGDFFGGVLLRADTVGTTYLADANPDGNSGAVYKFTSGGASMAGDWPTLGGGNRRQHKSRTYPYQFVELGAFYGGDPSSQGVFSVDVLGRAIGYAHGSPGYPYYSTPTDWYGSFWTGSSPAYMGSLSSPVTRNWTTAGNLAGHAVGYRDSGPVVLPNGLSTPSSTTAVLLPLPSGYSGGIAEDINAGSSIVGYSSTGGNPRVIRWDYSGGIWIDSEIGAPTDPQTGAYLQAQPSAISDNKRIAGIAKFQATGLWQGFTSPPGIEDFSSVEPLGSFGGLQSSAADVHDVSGTVGWAHKLTGGLNYRRAFLVPNDVFTLSSGDELPGFSGLPANGVWQSESWGVNCSGQVIGRAQTANSTTAPYRAFLRQPGAAALTDLSATYAPSGWVLSAAWGVSDAGHIVGSGTKNGATRQWMIYPTPLE